MASLQKKGMPYVRLGNSGLKVSKIILGCMSYGTPKWQSWVLPEEESIKQIKAAYDAGINAFDTANVYSYGESERILGKAIKQLKLPRDEIVVMTKLYATVGREPSIKFDGVDPDDVGYVNQHDYAIANKLTPFISMQNHYSLVYREEEREMFPTLKHFGVGSIPWSPLGRGLLTRPLSESTTRGKVDRFIGAYSKGSEGTATIVNRVEEVAKKRGISMAQVALAWVFQKDGVSAPIIGATSMDHLNDLIGSVNVQLTPDEVKYLEESYAPQAVIGHT
ncbi:hypothetical protein M378DRAFT_163370 [Amanita muscaria Koide BX008]|uniref:NADP-dependent oxidoreductase domain-containing protein n=1 Tax=Amanita muscaria (strain Koide BX008) TaxID=946122 RepID=A0A0C2WRP5_AMAMK|nr:hypothetical protein M378DRAFT_163370 [Amanita muscaria Koide BX008]